MKNIAEFTNPMGIKFNVVICRAGETYASGAVNNYGYDLITFYDARYNHCEHGQYVAAYAIETIMTAEHGIRLQGGVDEWVASLENIFAVKAAITKFLCGDSIDNKKSMVIDELGALADFRFVTSALFAAISNGNYDNHISDFEGSISSCADMLLDLHWSK